MGVMIHSFAKILEARSGFERCTDLQPLDSLSPTEPEGVKAGL